MSIFPLFTIITKNVYNIDFFENFFSKDNSQCNYTKLIGLVLIHKELSLVYTLYDHFQSYYN